ncbi:8731_t:CDS:2, partial [Racocetra fulgida]
YRALTTVSQDLPKEWLISSERYKIDEIMQKHIPLLEFDMKTQMQSDDSSDSDCEETKDTLEKGDYRNISTILQFLIPKLVVNKVLSYETFTIYLRVSGDERNDLIGDLSQTWTISKEMNKIKENHQCYPGYIHSSIFDKIRIADYV